MLLVILNQFLLYYKLGEDIHLTKNFSKVHLETDLHTQHFVLLNSTDCQFIQFKVVFFLKLKRERGLAFERPNPQLGTLLDIGFGDLILEVLKISAAIPTEFLWADVITR